MKRELLGNNHPDTEFTLNNLRSFYEGQGRHDEAEELRE